MIELGYALNVISLIFSNYLRTLLYVGLPIGIVEMIARRLSRRPKKPAVETMVDFAFVVCNLVMMFVLFRCLQIYQWFDGARAFFATDWEFINSTAEFVVAFLVIDFTAYWRHRLTHSSRLLWRAHAVHHGSQHLTWTSAQRLHPINALLNNCVEILPLYIAGFDMQTAYIAATFHTYYVLSLHADLQYSIGKLGWLFNTPTRHRVHHSENPEEANSNFAFVFIAWDRIFGTYCEVKLPMQTGLGADYPSGNFLSQMLMTRL